MERTQYLTIKYLDAQDIMESVCWTLKHYLEAKDNLYDRVNKVTDLRILEMISRLLDQDVNQKLKHCVLLVIGRATIGTKKTIESFCSRDFAQIFSRFLTSTKKESRYVTATSIANIILTDDVFYDYFYDLGLVEFIIEKINIENNLAVKGGFLELLCIFINRANSKQLEELIFEQEIINWLLLWLTKDSPDIDMQCLKALEHLLIQGEVQQIEEGQNEIANRILHHEYFENLMKVKESRDPGVYAFASRLTESYFGRVISLG